MDTIIENYLDEIDFNIRKTNNARFTDQKVTPDVLSIIADSILEFVGDDIEKEFTVKDIWDSIYSKDNILEVFRKPNIDDIKAKSEYNKFFGQPLKMLGYSQLLHEEKKGNRNFYKINNYKLLEYISIKEKNALKFIQYYLIKVLSDTGIYNLFDTFFTEQNKSSFDNLKQGFINFIISNTPINEELEPKRIFTKIINPLAFLFNKKGTKRGFMSKTSITYDELMYNRANWRDIGKNKGETREEYEERAIKEVNKRRGRYTDYSINRAKRTIYKLYHPNSEMRDELSRGEATQVHHIFMKSEFPKLADYVENLILLTGSQHISKAHPSNNTRIVDKDYQLLLLLAKSDNIKKSLDKGDIIYSVEDFIHVLNTGLSSSISVSSSLSEITTELSDIYNRGE